jgi:hypothetical protein
MQAIREKTARAREGGVALPPFRFEQMADPLGPQNSHRKRNSIKTIFVLPQLFPPNSQE